MENNEKMLPENSLACPLIGSQEVEVCLPITVKPFAKTGPIKTKCCGPAVVKPGSKNCAGVRNGECSFTVTQKLRVDIPIIFGAKAITEDTYVCCLKPCTEFCDDLGVGEYDKLEEYDEDEEYYEDEEVAE